MLRRGTAIIKVFLTIIQLLSKTVKVRCTKIKDGQTVCVSVVEAEPPERKDVAGGELDAVLDDVAFFGGGKLSAAFGLAAGFEGAVVYPEVGDGGGCDLVADSGLVQEECLAEAAGV